LDILLTHPTWHEMPPPMEIDRAQAHAGEPPVWHARRGQADPPLCHTQRHLLAGSHSGVRCSSVVSRDKVGERSPRGGDGGRHTNIPRCFGVARVGVKGDDGRESLPASIFHRARLLYIRHVLEVSRLQLAHVRYKRARALPQQQQHRQSQRPSVVDDEPSTPASS
jgi:hypothetical protein